MLFNQSLRRRISGSHGSVLPASQDPYGDPYQDQFGNVCCQQVKDLVTPHMKSIW